MTYTNSVRLRQRTFAAVRWTTVSMLGRAACGVVQLVIMARILEPSDFGVMAMVLAVIALAQIFSDMGISNAIIHKQTISHESLSSLYWLNICASSILMSMVMLVSPLLAAWYGEPRMQSVLVIVSMSFLANAVGQQVRLVAEKNLRFRELAKIELSAAIVSLGVATAIAIHGGGVYALVAGILVNSIALSALLWCCLSDGWRPQLRLRLEETREFLRFGAYAIGFSLSNTINMQADIFIGGRVLGADALGSYSLPKDLNLRLAMIINPIVTRVGLPVMAQVQADKAKLKTVYLNTLLMTASINFPVYVFIVVFAPEIVAVVFGPRWQDSVQLLRVLAVWGMVRSTGNPAGSLVFALGRADLAFWWSLGLMCVLTPAYWIGSKFGAYGLALSMLLSMLLMPLPQWWLVIRPLCGAGFVEYFKQLAIPLFVSSVAGYLAYVATSMPDQPVVRLALGVAVGGVSYLLLCIWLNRPWVLAMLELLTGHARGARPAGNAP